MIRTYTMLSTVALTLATGQALAAPVIIDAVHLTGDAAGTTGSDFSSFASAQLNSSGQILFRTTLGGGDATLDNNTAVFRTSGTSTTLIAREDDLLASGIRIQNFGDGAMADNGEVFYNLTVTGTGVTNANNGALISSSGTGASILLREGTAVDGVANVVSGTASPVATDTGVLIKAPLNGSGVNSSNNSAVLAVESGTPQLVVQEGDASPIGSTEFGNIGSMDAAQNGDIAFEANLRGTGATNDNDAAAFLIQTTGTTTLAREGELIGGRVGDSTYRAFSSLQVNNKGEVLTTATIEDTTTGDLTTGLFKLTGAADELLVLSGDAVTDGVGEFDTFTGNHSINNLGQMVFESSLVGTGVDTSNDNGFFAIDTDGSIFTIIREGDLFDLGGGDFSTVVALAAVSNALNDDGFFAFTARFANGVEGLFLANVFGNAEPIPVPGAAIVFASGIMLFGFARRRA